ncbi:hypothetical protein [Aeromonas phage phiWae14]|nr:hypothetical protein [Aeromonas phage phiWae14]
MHSIAIKALAEKIMVINGKIEASYVGEWTPEGADQRAVWETEIESLQATIEVLETM